MSLAKANSDSSAAGRAAAPAPPPQKQEDVTGKTTQGFENNNNNNNNITDSARSNNDTKLAADGSIDSDHTSAKPKWQSSNISPGEQLEAELKNVVVVQQRDQIISRKGHAEQETLGEQHQLAAGLKVTNLFLASRAGCPRSQDNNTENNNNNISSSDQSNTTNASNDSELDLVGPRSSAFNYHHQQSGAASHRQVLKRHNLSYFQRLFLRKWPYSIIVALAMASLIIGILLPALTVYLMQGLAPAQCSAPNGIYRHHMGAMSHSAAAEPASAFLVAQSSALEDGTTFELGKSLEAKGLYAADSELASAYKPAAGAAATASAAAPATSAASSSSSSSFHRLPTSVVPIHYELFVQPYIAPPFNFNGKVSITIKCMAPTTNITLHSLQLDVQEQTVRLVQLGAGQQATAQNSNSNNNNNNTATTAPKVKGLKYDRELQYVIVDLDSPLAAGKQYLLSLDFSGFLNDDLAGFYKISFDSKNSTGLTWVAATQFQATDARRAFPCFDEPVYKATFGIQIKHWNNMTALSNMPIKRSESSPDELWITDTFDKSVAMSTYLVAFAVTNFESRTEGNMSVWARPGFANSAEYALKIGNKILRFYEQFFGIDYPLPKMDMIALPDFNAGAMENWGLITYRETAMLYDRNVSSVVNKLRIATVVAHELAHQWFGNLVTPKWWDDLWLNEGFATYVEYLGVDHVEPDWRLLDHFVLDELQDTFRLDALSSSHQISVPVNNPDEVAEIFDKISYGKGASLIRMMNHFLGEKAFKLGLHRYLEALKYSNAEQADLWSYLSDALRDLSGGKQVIDIGRVMNSWTLQTGFPLVTLKRDYSSQEATLEQKRYQPAMLVSSKRAKPLIALAAINESQVSWEIPVSVSHESKLNNQLNADASEQVLWLHQNDTKPLSLAANLVPASQDEWMLINVNQVGYFRVNYDKRNWQLLIEQLAKEHKKLSEINRAQLLDDLFEMARGGLLDYALALDATKYLPKERDYLPWASVLTSLSYLDDMLQRTPLYGDFKDYLSHLVDPYYGRFKDLEWTRKSNDEATTSSMLDSMNLLLSVSWTCPINEHCIAKARSTFNTWRATGVNKIAPEFRFATYCQSIEHGNKHDWEFLWKAYEREQTSAERERIMRALACTKEPWILSRYLDYTFANKTRPIRRQDGALVFRMVAKNLHGHRLAFDYLKENWSTIRDYYGRSSFSFGQFIKALSSSMNTRTELADFVAFYESVKSDPGTGKRSFQNALEEVEANVEWRERNYKLLDTWIREFHATNVGKPGHK